MRRRTSTGFTLIEVTLAIAVTGVSLLTVLGLLPLIMENDQKSSASSIVPTLASQAIAFVKEKHAATATGTIPATPYTCYFTQDGERVEASHTSAIFKCEVTLKSLADLSVNAGSATLPDPGTHCLAANMVFTWPVGLAPHESRMRTLHATITDD